MAADLPARAARWLCLAVGLLIVYGSLYPFQFSMRDFHSPVELFLQLTWARTSRTDVLANLLLYLPLGALLSFALPARWSAARVAFIATLLGALLALSLETAQLFEPRRVSSLTDLVLNTVGTFAGAVLALGLRAAAERLEDAMTVIDLRAAPMALLLVGAWVTARLAPFDWSASWPAWRRSLRPLWQAPSLPPATLLGHLAAWAVIVVALRATVRRDAGFVVLALLVLGVAAGRIAGTGLVLAWPELLALGVALALWPLAESLGDRLLTGVALALLATAVLAAGLAPAGYFGSLGAAAHQFTLAPLDAAALGTLAQGAERCFTAGALVWLLARLGAGALAAGLLGAALLLAVEAVQLYMPGRTSTLTAPALALLAAGLVALVEPAERSSTPAAR